MKGLRLARGIASLAGRVTPVGLPIRPDVIHLSRCIFMGYHGDMTALFPETLPPAEVRLYYEDSLLRLEQPHVDLLCPP